MDALIAERKVLAAQLAGCERGAFPGSRAAREESAAMRALAAFDAAHPEVLVAASSPMSDGAARALRGED